MFEMEEQYDVVGCRVVKMAVGWLQLLVRIQCDEGESGRSQQW